MLVSLNKFLSLVFSLSLFLSPISLRAEERQEGIFSKMKGWFQVPSLGKETSQEAVYLQVKDRLQWKRYDFTQHCGFSAQFPENPDHSGQIIEIPQSDLTIRYDTYVAETKSDGSVYVVSVWEYPESVDIRRPELNLQEGFAGMLQALPESQVLFMKASEMQGHKSLEFWISCEDVFFRGFLISVNHTLYQVFMVYRNKDPKSLDHEYDTFTQSFKITKIREARSADLIRKKVRL